MMASHPPVEALCWLLIDPATVPSQLRHRARPVSLVPLLPQEVQQMLDQPDTWRRLAEEDETLAAALVRGQPITATARLLGVTPRTVERRLARMRDHFAVDSTEELIAQLSRLGF